jgi:tripartite-type tricarboxylate transporter receptor subunit TctC
VQSKAPPDTVAKIYTDLRKIADNPDLRGKISEMGLEPTATSKEEFATFLKSELDKWGAIIRERNIRLEQ